MPTQPVVCACKANVMLSPLTKYVTLYAPFDADLLPKHRSASTSTKHVLDQCVHVYQTSPSTYLVMYTVVHDKISDNLSAFCHKGVNVNCAGAVHV